MGLNHRFLYQNGPFKVTVIKCQGQIDITSPDMCGIPQLNRLRISRGKSPIGATRRKFYPVKFEDYLTGVS